MAVTARNTSDVAVRDACFAVFVDDSGRQGASAGRGCDSDDGSDGVTTIGGIQPGACLLVGSSVPDGYIVGREQPFTVASGQTTAVSFQAANGGRTVRIAKVDTGDDPLPGACFTINEDLGDGQAGDFVAGNCSDPTATDGLVVITGVASGAYVLVETQAPAGFIAGPNLSFTLAAGFGSYNLTVRNAPIESPGNLIVKKTDEHEAALGGACFNVFLDATSLPLGTAYLLADESEAQRLLRRLPSSHSPQHPDWTPHAPYPVWPWQPSGRRHGPRP